MKPVKFVRVVVVGNVPFPFDMLRYDACWPETERDSAVIERSLRYEDGPHRVCLLRLHEGGRPLVTPDRWRSFGWTVETQEHTESPRWDALQVKP